MKHARIMILTVVIVAIAAFSVSADDRFSLNADYLVPVGNDQIGQSIGVGASYRFWGIFNFTGTMYTEILYGADNLFNIRQIRPIGLFSGGLGMEIPLGGFDLNFGWHKYFTGTSAETGVFPFSDSYTVGAGVDLSPSFGVAIYSRRLYNFSDQAIADEGLNIETSEDTVETIGIGLRFHLF